jgi:hypothetical protein
VKINEYAKAVGGGVVAFLGAFDAASASGSVGGEGVTANEWVRVVVITIAAAAAVFLIPNADPAPKATLTVEATSTAPQGYTDNGVVR